MDGMGWRCVTPILGHWRDLKSINRAIPGESPSNVYSALSNPQIPTRLLFLEVGSSLQLIQHLPLSSNTISKSMSVSMATQAKCLLLLVMVVGWTSGARGHATWISNGASRGFYATTSYPEGSTWLSMDTYSRKKALCWLGFTWTKSASGCTHSHKIVDLLVLTDAVAVGSASGHLLADRDIM